MPFNPDDAAPPDSGIFGLPTTCDEASIVIIPVPFDATTSYRAGTARGPSAVVEATMQVDLFDHRFGKVYEAGLFAEPVSDEIASLSAAARELAAAIIARGGATDADADDVALIDAAGERVRAFARVRAQAALSRGKVPALLGGEHAVSLGAIEACAAAGESFGVLQVDAHMDLRDAYEGFAFSHASIMHNVLSRVPAVTRLVQVGIRDYAEGERAFADRQEGRVVTFFDEDLAEALDSGSSFVQIARRAVAELPENVYISFDIDALDPALCPHTGTPVPGGLSFHQASTLLAEVRRSGRRVVGFDLVEVAPGPGSIDAIVGARILYRLCGCARTATA